MKPLRKQRNIVVLGFTMVGKTAICTRFANNRFDDRYEPTYENNFTRIYRHKGEDVECTVKDTQGLIEQEFFRADYGLGYHGYVLVYSIASRRSLENLKSINAKLINLIGTTKVPRVLVGNKADLEAEDGLREVTTAQGQALAAEWGCAFTECSAKINHNIENVFRLVLEEVDKQMGPEPAKLSSTRCIDLAACCGLEESSSGNTRVELFVRLLVALILLLGIAAVVAGTILGIQTQDREADLLAYILFGFGFIITCISGLGWYGVRQNSQEFLRVYCVSLALVLITEVVVYIILFSNLRLFQRYSLEAAMITALALLAEVLSICFVGCFQSMLMPSFTNSPFHEHSSAGYTWSPVPSRDSDRY